MYNNAKKDLDYALHFTDVFRSINSIAQREAACLALQVPYVLEPIGDEDLVVGFMKHGYVGFSPQYGGHYTYYCHFDKIMASLDSLRDQVDSEYISAVEAMCSFWGKERTEAKVQMKIREKYPDKRTVSYFSACRVAGLNVDLDLLLQLGLNGLKARTDEFRCLNGDSEFYKACDLSIDIISRACIRYAEEAGQLQSLATGQRKEDLAEISGIFRNIATEKPETFKEAL